jgi:hypothetical protein
LHRLPDVKNILFSFVGPELNVGAETEANDGWAGIPNCADCQGRARSARYRCFRMKYEEFKATDYFQEPDLVFAQNCGFSEFSDEERFRCYCQYKYPKKILYLYFCSRFLQFLALYFWYSTIAGQNSLLGT